MKLNFPVDFNFILELSTKNSTWKVKKKKFSLLQYFVSSSGPNPLCRQTLSSKLTQLTKPRQTSLPPEPQEPMSLSFYRGLFASSRQTTAADRNTWRHQRDRSVAGGRGAHGHYHHSAGAQDTKPEGQLIVRAHPTALQIFPAHFVSWIHNVITVFPPPSGETRQLENWHSPSGKDREMTSRQAMSKQTLLQTCG